jgi:hypothetical protein
LSTSLPYGHALEARGQFRAMPLMQLDDDEVFSLMAELFPSQRDSPREEVVRALEQMERIGMLEVVVTDDEVVLRLPLSPDRGRLTVARKRR